MPTKSNPKPRQPTATAREGWRGYAAMPPRRYAALIASEGDRVKRGEMLSEVPEEYRELVKTHVTNAFYRRGKK